MEYPIYTEDFYYDLFTGGYFDPSKMYKNITDDSVINQQDVERAIEVIELYKQVLIDNNLMEEDE